MQPVIQALRAQSILIGVPKTSPGVHSSSMPLNLKVSFQKTDKGWGSSELVSRNPHAQWDYTATGPLILL